MTSTTAMTAATCVLSGSAAPPSHHCRRSLRFDAVRRCEATGRLRSAAKAVTTAHRRTRASSSSAAAASFVASAFGGRGDPHGTGMSWSSSRKQLVEALTQGSALARAPCAWYVDHSDRPDGGALGSSSSSVSAAGVVSSSAGSASASVVRVRARQAAVSHEALAHADSADCAALRFELEMHLRTGGATVLLCPIVDPLIVDMAAMPELGGFDGFGEEEGDEMDDDDAAGASPGPFGTLARSVDFDGSTSGSPSKKSGRVLVEGTVCKCDPNDPGDCCARGLASYCTSCPVLASMDEPNAASAIEVTGGSVDCAHCGMSADVGDASFAGRVGDCAFAKAIKAAAAQTHGERHQYYAAIVQTPHGHGVSDTVEGVGYEEFLVYRPSGDAWIAGALPPPTSVRRASFGPQLRGELESLAVEHPGWS